MDSSRTKKIAATGIKHKIIRPGELLRRRMGALPGDEAMFDLSYRPTSIDTMPVDIVAGVSRLLAGIVVRRAQYVDSPDIDRMDETSR